MNIKILFLCLLSLRSVEPSAVRSVESDSLEDFRLLKEDTHRYVLHCYQNCLRARQCTREAIESTDQELIDKKYVADLANIRKDAKPFFDKTNEQWDMLWHLNQPDIEIYEQQRRVQLEILQRTKLEEEKAAEARWQRKFNDTVYLEQLRHKEQFIPITEELNRQINAKFRPDITRRYRQELRVIDDQYETKCKPFLPLNVQLRNSLQETVIPYLVFKGRYEEAQRARDARLG
jgi:hypothetical protein